MTIDEISKHLKEPFPFDAIEWKIQFAIKEKLRGKAVAYVDSRALQNRLDEVVGKFNWSNEFMLWQPESQICGISIYDETRSIWVTKYDGAENTDYQPIKGGLSDSFKRAGVMWGLGRYLYGMDGIWVDIEEKGKSYGIKDDQKQHLENYYNTILKGQNVSNSQHPATNSNAPNNNQVAADSGTAQQQSANNPVAYEYKVSVMKPTGNSTYIELLDKTGKKITAYAPKDSPGLVNGALIKKIQMSEKTAEFGQYYLINKYEIAA